MYTHAETFLRLEQLGDRFPGYRPTFDFSRPLIDWWHRKLARCPRQDETLIQVKNRRWFGGEIIPGWLRREDALKIYELAYFASGDILELGCYHGLSTSIIARANRKSGRRRGICTFDLDPSCVEATQQNLKSLGLDRDVTVLCDDATQAAKRLAAQQKRFGFIFIDHSHEYDPVYGVCRELAAITAPGGFCLFHDFNDPRNRNPDDKNYGVYQAVMNGLDHKRFEFCGIYGCTGLYRALAA
jgi:predicted O-methyltransferase YrrM